MAPERRHDLWQRVSEYSIDVSFSRKLNPKCEALNRRGELRVDSRSIAPWIESIPADLREACRIQSVQAVGRTVAVTTQPLVAQTGWDTVGT